MSKAQAPGVGSEGVGGQGGISRSPSDSGLPSGRAVKAGRASSAPTNGDALAPGGRALGVFPGAHSQEGWLLLLLAEAPSIFPGPQGLLWALGLMPTRNPR